MKECTFKPKTLWRSRSAAQTPRSHSLNKQQEPPAGRQRPQRASISADEALDRSASNNIPDCCPTSTFEVCLHSMHAWMDLLALQKTKHCWQQSVKA